MQQFTNARGEHTCDEIWFLEHFPVFTQGQNGKPDHILCHTSIPIIQTDRGGQVTYHGPGQLMVYTLIDLKRKHWHVRQFVTLLELAVIQLAKQHHIQACANQNAPGVYLQNADGQGPKLASIGLRVRRGCAYHGLALNVAMDLRPFSLIDPCGFKGLKMAQLSELGGATTITEAGQQLLPHLISHFGYTKINSLSGNELAKIDGNKCD